MAGATAVQIGTANFVDPGRSVAIVDGLRDWCASHGVARAADLVGSLRTDDGGPP